ncbi:MAG: hypothetical protein WC712_00100 [Candidatus Brocadiia bacterium]
MPGESSTHPQSDEPRTSGEQPRVSWIELSFVLIIFAGVGFLLTVLFLYPRDWAAEDKRKVELCQQNLRSLYDALREYASTRNGMKFPPEMDDFLHHGKLEWLSLGVCPACYRRFSIQLIPGWTMADVNDHPKDLLCYDYNEDELRYMKLADPDQIIDPEKSDKASNTIVRRGLTKEEQWAVLTGKFSEVPSVIFDNRDQLREVRDKYLREQTMAHNHKEGRNVLLLDGTVKWVDEGEFSRMRLAVLYRVLVKQANANDGVFPKDVAWAVVNAVTEPDKPEERWLVHSLAIDPADDTEFVGYEMPAKRIKLSDPPETMLCYSKNPVPLIGRNVLFLDGRVKFLSVADFAKLIETSK